MDLYRLSSDMKLVNQIGVTLSVDERMKLELALQKLTDTQKFDQLLFWGKIEGTNKDYFIALGLNFRGQFEFPTKKFFWSSNDFNFAELPEINEEYASQVDGFRQLFTGQHEKILIQVTDPENQEENQGGEEGEGEQKQVQDSDEDADVKVPPKNFSELDRLAYVVRAIETDCSLVPIGAFKLTASHELRYNDTFAGLTIEQANQISSYQHFTAPRSQEKKDFIARDEALFNFNFLDPIQNDLPKGSWSVQSDSSKCNVTVRSLLWPGYIGYHRANSRIFGYCYMGNGIKNCDLPFLL